MEPDEIQKTIKDRFSRIANFPASEKRVPAGPESAKNLGYDPQEIDSFPPSVTDH